MFRRAFHLRTAFGGAARPTFVGLALAACLLCGIAHADDSIATYAIVIGSNTGGPGQVDLHYAEDDARRVAAVLTELGGYAPANVEVITHPTPAELRDRLTALAQRVQADAAAGRQARIFFYYSGHARAEAIDLGSEEMPITELRERLFAVPATLTVVVLDACQSGAFSRIKGAAPAADFSFSSRQHLDAAGVAVLASSSGSELSQESEELHGSYFTHNLIVGLRGAGDANGDGQVTLDEAYRYAYNQTLLATAETAVGGQHVTFEADLKGHGDVALSFPRAASAAIVLPAAMAGKALVSDRRAHEVVAEIYKAKGAPVRIAVAPGDYEVLVRDGDHLERCEVAAPGMVDIGACRREAIVETRTKGGGFWKPTRVEVTFTTGGERKDHYTDNLATFGYDEQGFANLTTGFQVTALREVARRLWVGGQVASQFMPGYSESVTGAPDVPPQTFSWDTTAVNAVARYMQPFGTERVGAYAQGVVGLGIGRTTLKGEDETSHDTYFGPWLGAGAGLYVDTRVGFGVSMGYEYEYAPVIKDLIGDTHATGGNRFTFSLTERF